MDFRTYFEGLNSDEQDAFGLRAGTSGNYIRVHLMANPPRRTPRPDLMKKLAEASDGAVTQADVIAHFYGDAVA